MIVMQVIICNADMDLGRRVFTAWRISLRNPWKVLAKFDERVVTEI